VIGLDTNILVRYLVTDDPAQFRTAEDFITQSNNRGIRLYVDDVVLCELVWVLRSAYKLNRQKIASIIEDVLKRNRFVFDDDRILVAALDDYIAGAGDFADYLIGRRNKHAGCDLTATFDRGLRDDPSFRVL
jgi:predicted nucleic-acid-binding protein